MQLGYVLERSLGYEQFTDLSAVVSLNVPANCQLVLVSAETQMVRWRDDGVNPTASVGYPLPAGTAELQYTATAARALRFIQSAASAKLNVTYYGG